MANHGTQPFGNVNMRVAVRIRPHNEREGSARSVIQVLDDQVLLFDPATGNSDKRGVPNHFKRAKDEKYCFDRVYDAFATQADVYEGSAKFLIEGVMKGYNATVFAYGATGSGKTHTMIGNETAGPGVMVHVVKDLFESIENAKSDYKCKIVLSYLEVYNEQIHDLLVTSPEEQKPLELREDGDKGCVVGKLSEHEISSAEGVFDLLARGNAMRRQSPTEQNATSSRSHAVLQIRCVAEDRLAGLSGTRRIGKLSLIDLAGSERAAISKNRGATQFEGANINKSLLALGNCINALCDGGRYIPYRNSKLTRLLSLEDTHNTLKYANRAKNIKLRVSANEHRVETHIGQYKVIINQLKVEVLEYRKKLNEAQQNKTMPQQEKQEEETMDRLYNELKENFEARLQKRREQLDLQERDRLNSKTVELKREEILFWEDQHNPGTPPHILKSRAEIKQLLKQTSINGEKRASLGLQLQELVAKRNRILEESAKLKSNTRRLLLKDADRANSLELERLELRKQLTALEEDGKESSAYIKQLQLELASYREAVQNQTSTAAIPHAQRGMPAPPTPSVRFTGFNSPAAKSSPSMEYIGAPQLMSPAKRRASMSALDSRENNAANFPPISPAKSRLQFALPSGLSTPRKEFDPPQSPGRASYADVIRRNSSSTPIANEKHEQEQPLFPITPQSQSHSTQQSVGAPSPAFTLPSYAQSTYSSQRKTANLREKVKRLSDDKNQVHAPFTPTSNSNSDYAYMSSAKTQALSGLAASIRNAPRLRDMKENKRFTFPSKVATPK